MVLQITRAVVHRIQPIIRDTLVKDLLPFISDMLLERFIPVTQQAVEACLAERSYTAVESGSRDKDAFYSSDSK
jgi:hypothetical protein